MWSGARLPVVVLFLLSASGSSTAGIGEMLHTTEPHDLDTGTDAFQTPKFLDVQDVQLAEADINAIALHLYPDGPEPPNGADPLHTPWALVGLPLPEGVLLRWNQPLAGAPDAYRVYRAVDGGVPELLAEVPDPFHLDTTAWDENATVLSYSVTALYTDDGLPKESSSSNVFVMPGPLGNCRLAWVYGSNEFGVNPSYLECLQSEGRSGQ